MCDEFINLTIDNLETEHLCCIIRSKKPHQGIMAKKQWLSERIKEGHIFMTGPATTVFEGKIKV